MRLSSQECERFLVQTLGMKDNDQVVEQIVKDANGWIGGAQLMAIAGNSPYSSRTVFASADQQVMFDYIEKQIYSALTQEEQLFLEKTSVLSYFNEQICETYLPEYRFAHMMKQITEKNLFVIQMDEEKQEYRYHAILREYLLHRLERDRKREELLFCKAADIMFTYQDYGECVRLLQKIGDSERLMEVLLKMPQNSETFGYMMQIPMEEIGKNANFAYQYFFCYYASLQLEQCRKIYECIKKNLKDDITFQGFKHADLFFDINWEYTGVHILSLEQMDVMPLNEITKAYLLIKEAYFLFLEDEIPKAFTYLDRAEMIYQMTGNIYIEIFVLLERTQMLEEYGEFEKLIPMYQKMKKLLVDVPTMWSSYYIGIAGVYIRQMRIKEAKEALDQANDNKIKQVKSVQSAYLYTLAEWYYVHGEPDKTWDMYMELSQEKMYQSIFFSARILRYPIYRGKDARLSESFLENYEKASKQMKSMDTDLLYAGIVYEEKDKEKGMQLLDRLLGKARKVQNKLKIVECALMKARFLYQQSNDRKKVMTLMVEALAYALPEKIRVPFWFEKEFLSSFMEKEKKVIEDSWSREQIQFIHRSIMKSDTQNQSMDYEMNLTEKSCFGLTDREIEVLDQIADGDSNKQIADHLCISIATVKTHLINIYSKLGVNNRTAAVNKYKR